LEITYKHKYFFFFSAFLAAFYLVLTSDFPTADNHVSYCMIHHATGYPCPACGTGRALIFLRYGEFCSSLMYNPLGYIILGMSLTSIGLMVKDLIRKEDRFVGIITTKLPTPVIILIAIFTLVNGIWNIYKGV